MTPPDKEGVGMTVPPTIKSHNHPLLQVTDEVDVDSLMMDIEQPKKSPKEEGVPTVKSSSFTIPSGVSTFMESLNPKDVETLAHLLKPIILAADGKKKELEECAVPTPSVTTSASDKKDDSEWHNPYSESTYSLFYLCSADSFAFWYAFFVYVIQITTILLTLIDIVDWGGNGLDMPPNVDLIVTIAQGVALFQALAFQSDLLEVVAKLKDGFHPEVLEKHPGATYATWLLSCIAQLMAGLLLLLTIYILTMQVDSVLGIMLNFAALHFMADIDNVAFDLAKAGFVGNRLQSAANDVVNFQVRKPSEDQGLLLRSWKAGVFLLILVVMITGYVTIVVFRTSGKYMCNTIIVNMGDSFVPSLGTFNGIYDLDFSTGSGLEWRAEYLERRSVEIDAHGRGVFGYCNDINAWTFRVQPKENQEDSGPCDWIARSSETDTYDITETGRIQWFVRDETNREVVLEPFSLFCFDCSNEDAEGSDDCGGKGTCSNAVCDCEDGWYGLRCEFVRPCPWINLDARTDKFASTRDWASNYQSIELGDSTLVEAYHRPVYIHEYESGDFDVVMFTGGRWALTSSVFLPYAGRIPSYELSDGHDDVGSDIGNYFKHAFHGYKGFSTNLSVAFLSDYMEMGTHLSSSSPVGFSWFFAEEAIADNQNQGIGNGISTEFLCRACDESSNPCLYDGKCSGGDCVCSLDSSGSLCEIPPVRNGHCDPFFNKPEFKMDGGDCCESTCVSTSQYACGAEKDGYVSTGYFHCGQPNDKWQSKHFNGDAGSFSGFAVDLSRGSLAVSELLQDRVRIYDKVGSSWVLRDTILGSPNTYFGTGVLGLSSGPFNVVNNPSFRAPLTVAVQDGFRTLRIYKCNVDGCSQSQAIELVQDFALSDDGTVLATSLHVLNEPPRAINVYKTVDGIFQMRDTVIIRRNTMASNLLSMALSSEGDRLAVQTQMTDFDEASNFEVVMDENVVVMAWNESSSAYEVEAEFRFESPLNTLHFPLSLSFNHHGNVLAYGFPECKGTQIQIKEINGELGWVARTAPSLNTTACMENKRPDKNNALALSGDGDRIAFRVGTKVSYFHWESENWNPIGDPFPLIHYPVAMSSDGTELAIGSPKDGIGGVTTVYTLPGRKQCPSGMSLLRLSLTLDRLPGDVVWSLVNNRAGEVLFQQDSYPQEYTFATILEETCVPADSCYVFTIYNKRNRGLLAPGSYAIFMDGENVAQGTVSDLFAREQFGSCASCPTGTEQFTMMMLTCGPMDWALKEMIDQGANFTILHADNAYGRYRERWEAQLWANTTDETFEWFTIYQNCNEHSISDCEKLIPVFHDACLDPAECYGVRVLSPLKYNAYLELVFGEQRENAKPVTAICAGENFYVGMCPQEEDWWNTQAPSQNVSQPP
ncbi:expressed unknown protein [Seminavis robusta]|uniref:EGF-like domain-containing protein n=1 Tax=Seminavis robusta TaxID=568900 RepID=A0A9N8E306_9STRA|nr:expressed unknown protein [Seminavis robusta]|eukprot:Sro600_g173340.1 n/a (1387) ;mRNA; f:5190-9607